MLDASFLEKAAELANAKTQRITLAGRELLVHDGEVIQDVLVKKPAPEAVVVHTLSGLRDYLRENRDELALDGIAVHVASPTQVDVVSAIDDETQQRFVHLSAKCYDRLSAVKGFQYGAFLSAETMVISLMALFKESSDRQALIHLLSNVEQGAVRTDEDDGVSQKVTVRHGISLQAERRVPNPVTLAPHRTFVEIEQPESSFVFRMRASNDADKAGAALFEADGGAWRDVAIARIREWLNAELAEGVAILA
jgi:hypothetical protein